MTWTRAQIEQLQKAGKIRGFVDKGIEKKIVKKVRSRSGKRKDLNDMYLRSQWEANYARYLNLLLKWKQIVKWEYEVDEFEFENIKRGNRFYKPDFKVWTTIKVFEYHEVKGWMDQTSRTKIKRFMKYYPKFVLKIIDHAWFKQNTSRLEPLIPYWETQ